MKFIRAKLSDTDKLEICIVFLLISSATILVLLAIATSRGNDVDYFKERLLNLEHRFNIAEKARDGIQIRLNEEEKKSLEANQKILDVQNRIQETEKWIEEYNKLPHLPKPKQPKSQLRPL